MVGAHRAVGARHEPVALGQGSGSAGRKGRGGCLRGKQVLCHAGNGCIEGRRIGGFLIFEPCGGLRGRRARIGVVGCFDSRNDGRFRVGVRPLDVGGDLLPRAVGHVGREHLVGREACSRAVGGGHRQPAGGRAGSVCLRGGRQADGRQHEGEGAGEQSDQATAKSRVSAHRYRPLSLPNSYGADGGAPPRALEGRRLPRRRRRAPPDPRGAA